MLSSVLSEDQDRTYAVWKERRKDGGGRVVAFMGDDENSEAGQVMGDLIGG
jgi:hypothetical protein